MNTLVIVESPAKAKKIQGFLGSDFKVVSCKGHVRDLRENNLNIDITENGFVPHYAIVENRQAVVGELASLAKKADAVLLATDPDREGEAIAWHLIEALNLPPATTKRITFTEITEPAILNAVQNPRAIYQSLVDAQQARRILDRLVGYELSPLLWRQRRLGARAAGRVQSVALRLLVEREMEIRAFKPTSQYRFSANFALDGGHMITTKGRLELNNRDDAVAFLNRCIGAAFTISGIVKSPSKSSPPAPFITSSLQQEASSRLGFSVDRTMSLAQKLYEAGHISYMRSDSVLLSQGAINEAQSIITQLYGERYCHPGNHHTSNGNAQQGHQAIRPTDFARRTVAQDASAQKLYDLIWKRTLASQMPEATYERMTVAISSADLEFSATCRSLRFDGFTRVYETAQDDDSNSEQDPVLPDMQVGQALDVENIIASQAFSRPRGRYTEATLVRELEQRGIGRPSTYASTISVIKKRGYVQKRDADGVKRWCEELVLKGEHITRQTREEMAGKERSKLVPTDLGLVVTDYLMRHFDRVMDYEFTAKIESELDAIANNERNWQQMLAGFYGPFHTLVEETRASPDRIESKRMLGVDPFSGQPVSGRLGRFGPVIMIGEAGAPGADQSARFHSLRPGQYSVPGNYSG